MRFALIGDTHFCTELTRGGNCGEFSIDELPDHLRYSRMVNLVLEPMFERINALDVDFVISTGDFVEGGMSDSRERTYAEMEQALTNLAEKICAPVVIAKGTHEGSGNCPGARAFREVVMPRMAEDIGKKIEKEYFCFERENCAFILIDYLNFFPGGEQDVWLKNELESVCGKGRVVFLAGHPPLYNWGRHYFSDPRFSRRLIELCRIYPVSAYFCGHTHNQAISFHETKPGSGFLQVMASSVGYPRMDAIPLEEVHVIEPHSSCDHYLWGIIEDSAPGFYIIETNDKDIDIEWFKFNGGNKSLIRFPINRSRPVEVKKPAFRYFEHELKPEDMRQIKAAFLNVFGIYRDHESTEAVLNGGSLGALPGNGSYASRRCLAVRREELKNICYDNEVTIKTPATGEYALGSISLELLLWDNRIIRSRPSPEIYICGRRWREFICPGKTVNSKNGSKVNLNIEFAG